MADGSTTATGLETLHPFNSTGNLALVVVLSAGLVASRRTMEACSIDAPSKTGKVANEEDKARAKLELYRFLMSVH